MKLKSLILGSIAAAGLSTAGYAADLGVLTSLDVCDALGISGLTISSDTNCLQISGGVDYRLRIGDYRRDIVLAGTIDENVTAVGDDSFNGEELDWDTRTRAWLRVVGTSDSDFGPASAVIGLRQVDEWRVRNSGEGTAAGGNTGVRAGGDTTDGVILDESYVSIGDTTVITVGLRREGAAGSVANFSDDEPFSYLFSAQDAIDGDGILVNNDDDRFGGVVIQATTDVGNGISVAVGLENITNTFLRNDRNTADQTVGSVGAGTLVGVVSYAGESISAHLTAAKFGLLDDEGEVVPGSGLVGDADGFLIHAGASGTFDAFSARVALGYEDNYKFNDFDVLSGLASVQGEFDLFTLAVSGEFQSFDEDGVDQTDFGLSALASAQVTEGVSINLEGTWFRDDFNTNIVGEPETDSYRVVLSAAADISETIAVTAGVGTWFGDGVITSDGADDNVIYGVVGASWAPSDDFDAAVELQANDDGGYRGQFTASKTFD